MAERKEEVSEKDTSRQEGVEEKEGEVLGRQSEIRRGGGREGTGLRFDREGAEKNQTKGRRKRKRAHGRGATERSLNVRSEVQSLRSTG